ncbi:MAG: transglutaminase domain-containing protein [Oscillospiraceae bacterium]|nr:transglutaminase domain-containing protein [Oscillospiraceae bacterium]
MKPIFRGAAILALLLCLCLLASCGEPAETTPQTQPPQIYTVRFVMNGQELSVQQVEEGDCPEAVTISEKGILFSAWIDEAGRRVKPEQLAVTGDAIYTAQYFPILDRHVPYLFANEEGKLEPNGELTGQMLGDALAALAAEGASSWFPELPESAAIMTASQLKTILESFFTGTELDYAFEGVAEDSVTRGEFAVLMNQLLARGGSETVLLTQPITDSEVTDGSQQSIAMLEAAIAHTKDASGSDWTILGSVSAQGTGFINIQGWLYYIDDSGVMARDTTINNLAFGADGRYTCGDAELDQIVADVIKQLMEENPEGERLDILRDAFDYCVDTFTYLRKNAYAYGENGWEIEDAKVMFTGLRGNCYNYAAAFWALARGLGYDAVAYSGTCTGTDQPHGWVEIDFPDGRYIFDPEWQWAYFNRDVYDKDMFMIPLADGAWWNYKRYN